MRRGYLFYPATIVITVGLLLLRFVDPGWVELLRLRTFDLYQQLQPRPADPALPVTIVDIDDRSLAERGQWPWPRSLMADLITKLNESGAATIGVTIVFSEPDRYSPDAFAQAFPDLQAQQLSILRSLPDNDQRLAAALAAGRVVLGEFGSAQRSTALSGPPLTSTIAHDGPLPVPRYFDLIRNLPALEAGASGLGFLGLEAAPDGIQRRAAALAQVGDRLVPAFFVEVLRAASGAAAITARTDDGILRGLMVGTELDIPTDRTGQVWIRYRPYDPYRYVSATDVLGARIEPDQLAGRIVLVGVSAAGLSDVVTTPLAGLVPGIEVQAQLLETVLTRDYLERPDAADILELLAVLAACLLVALLVSHTGAVVSAAGTVLLAVGCLGISSYLFTQHNLLVSGTGAALSALLLFTVLAYVRYLREKQEQAQFRRAFSHYLSPVLVERLVEDPGQLRLGGETRQMTILVADLAGMTTMSEAYTPEELVQQLNEILTGVTASIQRHDGTLNTYMADSTMAFWNAPLEDAAHARNACESALDIQRHMKARAAARDHDADLVGMHRIPTRMFMGIDTGNCVVGNLGSDQRFQYSAIGDSVNVAARLSLLGRMYGCDIILGAATADMVPDLALLELDTIRVKGKNEPNRIYALLGGADDRQSDAFQDLLDRHMQIMNAYRARQWPAALQLVEEQIADPSRIPELHQYYDLMQARIAELEADPPDANWDGVFYMTEK